MREIFHELSAAGVEPNAAAAQAFERAKRELSGAAPTPTPTPTATSNEPAGAAAAAAAAAEGAPSPELLSREGLEARVKQLFAAEVARVRGRLGVG